MDEVPAPDSDELSDQDIRDLAGTDEATEKVRLRILRLLEMETRLTREALSTQGQALTLIQSTLSRTEATMSAVCDFLKANTVQLLAVEERMVSLEARVGTLERKP